MNNVKVEIQKGAQIKVVTESAAKHLVSSRGWSYVNVETFQGAPKPSTGVVVLKGKAKVEKTEDDVHISTVTDMDEEDNFDPTAEEAATDEKAAPKKRGPKAKK